MNLWALLLADDDEFEAASTALFCEMLGPPGQFMGLEPLIHTAEPPKEGKP